MSEIEHLVRRIIPLWRSRYSEWSDYRSTTRGEYPATLVLFISP